jgi:glycosyltransferase involved in cell wall biosynthesis/peptidoglycan/xylan/chitin deacetylase (PgdA/CDA1 family)
MTESEVVVTTSWDDGHRLDLRLADLLDRHRVPATFYVAPRSCELRPADRLTPPAMRELAQRHEIGAHTLTHRRLTTLEDDDARDEIRSGRDELEQVLGDRVRAFCYPGGAYRSAHVEMVRDEHFAVARTVRRFDTARPFRPFELATTVHAYRHLSDPPRLLRTRRLGRGLRRSRDWATLAIDLFDEVLMTGGVFHLWGHSWEIEARDDWARLDRVLAHVGGRDDVTYRTNSELVDGAPIPARPPVVQVAPFYPPHLGGTENVARTIAEGLAATRPVTVLTTRSGARDAPKWERAGCLTVRRLPSVEISNLPINPSLPVELLCGDRDSIIHVHATQAFAPEVAWAVARLQRRPLIAHFHLDVEPSGPLGGVWTLYKRVVLGPVLRRADRVIVLTPEQAAFVEATHGVDRARIAVVPNGVSDDHFWPPRPRSGGDLKLLFVGRLSPQKNVARLLRAMALVEAGVSLRIVGDGVERDALLALADELELSNVEFVGSKAGAELVEEYRSADAFVLSSDREGMPLVVLEAMAASLPVIGTDVMGVADTVGCDGLLAAPRPDALAAAITRLALDPVLHVRLGVASAARAKDLRWSNAMALLDRVYDEATR